MLLVYPIREGFQLKKYLIRKFMATKTLKIKQIKSPIGYKQKAKSTLIALGLKKMNQTVEHKDCPQLRGMINIVSYLVEVKE